MYLPMVKSGRLVERYQMGEYTGLLVTDCESDGLIHYDHVLFVYRSGEQAPCYAVAAEMNKLMIEHEQGRFLGVFPGSGHANLGLSPDWRDMDRFVQRALEVVVEHFKIEVMPELQPIPPAQRLDD